MFEVKPRKALLWRRLFGAKTIATTGEVQPQEPWPRYEKEILK